ncbi:MAG: hypothetical protein ACN2B6_05575 [Rickettsiales bacterium]
MPSAIESTMYETRNIPISSLTPANARGVDSDKIIDIISEALSESGFNISVDVKHPKKIENWQVPYAVIRKVARGKGQPKDAIVIDTDDITYLLSQWDEVTKKAEEIAAQNDMGRGGSSRTT